MRLLLLVLLLNVLFVQSFVLKTYPKSILALKAKAKGKASDKVRVRLLVDIKGVGQNGDIVNIGSAQWLNVLQPKKQGEKITDDQMKQIEAARVENEAKEFTIAADLSEQLTSLKAIDIKKKIGKAGKLFGTVQIKHIMEELESQVSLKVLSEKSISLVDLKDEGGADLLTAGEIRTAGSFVGKIKLHPKIEPTSFIINIVSE